MTPFFLRDWPNCDIIGFMTYNRRSHAYNKYDSIYISEETTTKFLVLCSFNYYLAICKPLLFNNKKQTILLIGLCHDIVPFYMS